MQVEGGDEETDEEEQAEQEGEDEAMAQPSPMPAPSPEAAAVSPSPLPAKPRLASKVVVPSPGVFEPRRVRSLPAGRVAGM